jgi:hypothetical protein
MSVSYPSSTRLLVSNPRHHALPNASTFIRGTVLLPNDDVLSTADASTECFEENLQPNGALLPNSALMSVSSLYQFLLLTQLQHKSMHHHGQSLPHHLPIELKIDAR